MFILTSSWQNAHSGHWKVAMKVEAPGQQVPQKHYFATQPAP
jgi:hypothetical protein